MFYELFILVSYALLGAGIKYIDQAYDLEVFSRDKANLMAVPIAGLMAYLIISDPPSAIILLSILLTVAITRKIDNSAFYAGTGVLLFLLIIFHDILEISWLPLGALILSGILDEAGNDWTDRRQKKRRYAPNQSNLDDSLFKKFREFFFLHRFTMKITILALALLGFFSYLYFFALLLFDLAYLLIEQYSFSIKRYSLTRAGLSTIS